MKDVEQNAERWLDQARHDLESARINLEVRFYSDACFMSEQSAQKALKAYLQLRGKECLPIYSVRELARLCCRHDRGFKKAAEYGRALDRYYVLTRYPDTLPPPAVPYKSYTKKEAAQAIKFAKEILQLVRKKIRR